jgi:hypothetical protein
MKNYPYLPDLLGLPGLPGLLGLQRDWVIVRVMFGVVFVEWIEFLLVFLLWEHF